MAGLTTHVLDLAHGRPAAGVAITLYARDRDGVLSPIAKARTNDDGRCPNPLLDQEGMKPGRYQLDFHVGDYYRALGVKLNEPAFLDIVPIVFGIADAASHYHVPLLISPYGYSTYRGS
ncbi:MAG: hydroxyisourate hydrolase [Parvularculaceae bacterium]